MNTPLTYAPPAGTPLDEVLERPRGNCAKSGFTPIAIYMCQEHRLSLAKTIGSRSEASLFLPPIIVDHNLSYDRIVFVGDATGDRRLIVELAQ